MKKYILSFLLTLSSVHAVELKFIGPCEENFIMKTEVTEAYENVGQLTIETLTKFSIPHLGTYEGLHSAFETPVGNDAIEILSKDEMRVYGWCFTVDGEQSELLPHEVLLTEETKSVVWQFSYAHYKKGEWVSFCTPAWKVKLASLCKDPTAEK